MSDTPKPRGPVTVWLNYGCEGWHPNEFESEEQALEFIRCGGALAEFRITREMQLGAWVPSKAEDRG